MSQVFDADAFDGPSTGRRQLVLVDGRTFAISDELGQMHAPTHGLVHDDLRHLAGMVFVLEDARLEVLATGSPTPFAGVVVARAVRTDDPSARIVVTRRRWVAGGLREDVHLHNTTTRAQRWACRLRLSADFAHVFDVKAGMSGTPQRAVAEPGGFRIDAAVPGTGTRLRFSPPPDRFDEVTGDVLWDTEIAPRAEVVIVVTAEPVVDGAAAGLAFPLGSTPAEAIPMRRLDRWKATVPRLVSSDPRVAPVVEQALADVASLRIIDAEHADRAVVAAGAPWFMTLFGRDSLLTAWMTLPFEPSLARGVLETLADLRGHRYDGVAEEQPGRILHELRRHGGGGAFASRQRYYGTVDATPLFVMLAAEAWRWGAVGDAELRGLASALEAAVGWILGDGDGDGDGFVDYERQHPAGLSNQGWKDSWDGVTFADGTLPDGRIALVEVQGYAYAALVGAAQLADAGHLALDAGRLRTLADDLRRRFNERFWDDRGWFAMGLDGAGRRIDSLTTNPGHALWAGIADPQLANAYLDRLGDDAMWTGWGLRTLAETMGAYDPLSYHNGSVWPHDTAICAAGAARYGRWDVVDRLVDGAFDAAAHFGGRPPELFAGIARTEAPIPVAYPASCSPQAWSSASILLLVRTMLGLNPTPDRAALEFCRRDLDRVPELRIERLHFDGRPITVHHDAASTTVADAPTSP